MPKVKRPQIAGPVYDDDERDRAPPPRASSRRARDIPYSVAWFRDRVATYALGTIICGAVMLTIAAWMGGGLGVFGQRMNNGFNVIAGWAGISVKDVKVCAQVETEGRGRACHGVDPALNTRILTAADVRPGASILSADPVAVRDRVEKLDVGAVSVQRLWPDRVRIDVEQRKPIALSQEDGEGGAWRVVDQSGRAFAEADLAKYARLPRVVGKDASKAAAALVAAMEPYPNLSERMEIAYRIGSRRWDVKFTGRTDVVSFPVDAKLGEQLEALNLMQAQTRVLDLPATHIDARHPKYIALRPLPGAPPPPPGGA